MNDRDKEYDEFLEAWNKSNGNGPIQRQSASRTRTTYVSPKRKRAKKRKVRQRRMAVISVTVLAVLILIIVLIGKGCAGGNYDNVALSGVWKYDQYTEYVFDGEGKGCMCLDGNNYFAFIYKAKNGTLHLDFALDYVTDCQYTYSVEGDTLTLVGGEGTAELGKVYELTRAQA